MEGKLQAGKKVIDLVNEVRCKTLKLVKETKS